MTLKSTLKTLVKTVHRHKKTKPDIFIFTLPRTGSTLLGEMLNTDKDCKMASESFALNKDNLQVLQKYLKPEFLAERYVDVSSKDLECIKHYLHDLSLGKHWNAYYWSDFFKPYHQFRTCRTVFKIHKLTYYYEEIMQHFKTDFGLYLLRHPVSHSLSRLSKNWDVYIDLYANAKKIAPILPEKAKLKVMEIKNTGSDLEKFVVSWCLENYVFIRNYEEGNLPNNVFPVFYEDLVLNPEDTIKQICGKVKMAYSQKMLSVLNLPSSGIVHSTNETEDQIKAGNKNYLVNRWKDQVDDKTQHEVREILRCFEINLYNSI